MNSQFPHQSTPLSMMISEMVYHAVIAVERVVRFGLKPFGKAK